MSVATVAVVGSAVVGAGAAIYGANKNAKAIDKANETNQQIAADTNAANYRLWQESRGIGDGGKAINTKMPQWMSVNVGGAPRVRKLVKKSQYTADPYSRTRASMGFSTAKAAQSGGSSPGTSDPSWGKQNQAAESAAYAKSANMDRVNQAIFQQEYQLPPPSQAPQFGSDFSGPYNIGKPWWAEAQERGEKLGNFGQ